MEGLASYGSDDDSDESPQRTASPSYSHESDKSKKSLRETKGRLELKRNEAHVPLQDDNYDNIGMDLSENEEKSSSSSCSKSLTPSHTPPRSEKSTSSQQKADRKRNRSRTRSSSGSRSRGTNNGNEKSKEKRGKEREKVRRDRDRHGDRERNRSKTPTRTSKSKSGSRSRSRSPSNGTGASSTRRQAARDRGDRYRRDDKGKRYGYKDNNRRRSRSPRDTRVSRDLRVASSKDYRRHDLRDWDREFRESRDSTRDRESRDGSRDSSRPRDRYSKRFDRASNKLAHLEKMGIDVNKSQDKKFERFDTMPPTQSQVGTGPPIETDSRLLPPGVTGRLREQMEKRKALWQKKEPERDRDLPSTTAVAAPGTNKAGKVWEATTFAHDQEGKQANKFKRLMGIREPSSQSNKPLSDMAKQQEELFSSMEQQYEVARTATHTMRGVGLGFGSYQR